MTEEEKTRHDSEYQKMLALFVAFLKATGNEEKSEALYDLAELRTEYAFQHVLDGLGVDYDYATQLLLNKDDNMLTQHDVEMRKIIIAAILNLIDFSVCEEYQMCDEIEDIIGDSEIDFDSDEYYLLLEICEKYNDNYAAIENGDIKYAGIIAAFWSKISAGDYLVYWTQNDAHVRPTHMALQGYAAHKDEFPSWMIPPIEYNCRCFLKTIESGSVYGKIGQIKGTVSSIKKPVGISDVYSDSLAKCGRIFGPSHSYFSVKEKDKEMLLGFVTRLKEKYHV